MNCDQALESISAALDGELSARERAQLDAHLAHCPTCSALFDELAGQSRLLRQLDCQVPSRLSDRIMSSLPEQVTPARRFRAGRWRRWGTVAACAVLVLWAGLALPFGEDDAGLEPMVNNTVVGNNAAVPSAAQFSADGAVPQDALPGTDDSPLKAGERMAGVLGDVRTLSIPWTETMKIPAAQVLASAQDLADCLAEYAVQEQAELLNRYSDRYFDSAVLIAVTAASPDAPTVEEFVPVEDGYELVIHRETPAPAAGTRAAWLLLVEADGSISPEDPVTVVVDEA